MKTEHEKIVEILKSKLKIDGTKTFQWIDDVSIEKAAIIIDALYSAGEDVYVECAYKEAEYSAYPHPTSRADQRVMLKKLTRPTYSAGEEVSAKDWMNANHPDYTGKTKYHRFEVIKLLEDYRISKLTHPTESAGEEITELWFKNSIYDVEGKARLMKYGHFKAAIKELLNR